MNAVTEEGLPTIDKVCVAQRKSFDILSKAFKRGDVALMEVQLVATGEIVAAIVATNAHYGEEKIDPKGKPNRRRYQELEEVEFVPFAIMLNGNPYKLLNPAKPEGGFVSQQEAWREEKPNE